MSHMATESTRLPTALSLEVFFVSFLFLFHILTHIIYEKVIFQRADFTAGESSSIATAIPCFLSGLTDYWV